MWTKTLTALAVATILGLMTVTSIGSAMAMNGKKPPHKPGSPDTALTLWLVIFNNPGACATEPCSEADLGNPNVDTCILHATGSITNGGKAMLVASHYADAGGFGGAGDATELTGRHSCLFSTFLGGDDAGLIDPLTAEVHSVVRSHGVPFDDEEDGDLLDQITNFDDGACFLFPQAGDEDAVQAAQAALANGQNVCADAQFAIHQAPAGGTCVDGTEAACHDEQALSWFGIPDLEAMGIDNAEATTLQGVSPGISTMWRTPNSLTVVVQTDMTDLEDEGHSSDPRN